MLNWYSTYLYVLERQRELLRQAEERRLLAELRISRGDANPKRKHNAWPSAVSGQAQPQLPRLL